MKRMKFLFGQRRMQVLLTLAVLLLAASVVIGSGASFTSTSANPGNIFTAGNLKHTSTGAVMTVSKLKPDDVWVDAGSVTVTNTGDIDGAFSLSTSALVDTPGSGLGELSDVLQLRVMKGTTEVYNGPISAVGTAAAGTILSGAPAIYDFEVMFPDGDGAGPAGADNAYKASKISITFDWEAVNL